MGGEGQGHLRRQFTDRAPGECAVDAEPADDDADGLALTDGGRRTAVGGQRSQALRIGAGDRPELAGPCQGRVYGAQARVVAVVGNHDRLGRAVRARIADDVAERVGFGRIRHVLGRVVPDQHIGLQQVGQVALCVEWRHGWGCGEGGERYAPARTRVARIAHAERERRNEQEHDSEQRQRAENVRQQAGQRQGFAASGGDHGAP